MKRSTVWFLVVLALVALLVVFNGGELNVLGESGYEPYDTLLSANTFGTNKWSYWPAQEACKKAYKSTALVCVKPYVGVSAQDGSLIVSQVTGEPAGDTYLTSTGGFWGHAVRTNDLRLVNFKMTFRVDSYSYGGTCLWTNKGEVWCYRPEYGQRTSSASRSIELRWDDYELGHYQVFVNDELAQEGTIPAGEEFFFFTRPKVEYGNDASAASGVFKDPRVQRLFGCDPQEGETVTSACFGGPQTMNLDDLPGFRRFCLDQPATHCVNGVCTSSQQVMYALASNKNVNIADGEAWRFSYIDNSPSYGDQTGISNRCDAPVLIDDVEDLPVEDASVSQDTVCWGTYARWTGSEYAKRDTTLLSGEGVLIDTGNLKIDEATCPYDFSKQEYPGSLPASCFRFSVLGETFVDGQEKTVGQGLSLSLSDVRVQYTMDEERGKLYSWSARWCAQFDRDAITASATIPARVQEGTPVQAPVTITNTLPIGGQVLLNVFARPVIIGEPVQATLAVTAEHGSSVVSASLPASYVGLYDLTLTPVLQTEVGGITFTPSTGSYEVSTENPGGETSVTPTTQSLLARFLAWLQNLINTLLHS